MIQRILTLKMIQRILKMVQRILTLKMNQRILKMNARTSLALLTVPPCNPEFPPLSIRYS